MTRISPERLVGCYGDLCVYEIVSYFRKFSVVSCCLIGFLQVVEVVSGDCIIVADDSLPYGSPLAERRVYLSSIRRPKMENPRRDEQSDPYAREAKEHLRKRLIGRQVGTPFHLHLSCQ